MRQSARLGIACLFAACAIPGFGAVILTPTEDTYVQSDGSGPYGTVDALRVKWNNNDDGYHRKAWFQFDLLTVGGSLAGATLNLPFVNTNAGADPSGNWAFQVYGLTDETLDAWDEGVIRWATAPGNATGNPYTNGNTVDPTKTVSLGTFTVNGTGDGTTFGISGAALESLLAADTDDLATFILVRDTRGTGSKTYVHGVKSKDVNVG